MAKSVGALSEALRASHEQAGSHLAAISQIKSLLAEEREAHKRLLSEIASQSNRMLGLIEVVGQHVEQMRATTQAHVGQTESLMTLAKEMQASALSQAESLAAWRASADKGTAIVTVFSRKALQAIEGLEKKVDVMQSTQEAQGHELAAIKGKRGFTF